MADPVTKHFDRLAPIYGENFSGGKSGKQYEFAKRAELVGSFVSHSTGALLDCACGTGQISARALTAGSFSRAMLVDISKAMLDQATVRVSKVSGPAIETRQGNIFEYQPTAGEKFDVILCLGLVAHTGDLLRLLKHLTSMLDRSGRILLQTSLIDHPGVRLVRRLTANRYARREGYHLSYYTLADVTSASADCGLKVEQVTRYCFGVPFGDRVFPFGNYWLERFMAPVSARFGAEAICILSRRN